MTVPSLCPSGPTAAPVDPIVCCADLLALWVPVGAGLVVACSGGRDSMALLEACLALRQRHPLVVYHCHHGLRAEADGDAELVAGVARRAGLSCVVDRQPVRRWARQWRCGLEEAGRRLRREGFGRVLREHAAAAVLCAHHADDQAETVLANIFRGAGPVGEAGMPPALALPTGGWLLRPFLALTRQSIADWAGERGLQWREDASNRDCRFRRNWLRHRLLPEWEAVVPGFAAELVAWSLRRQDELAAIDKRIGPLWRAVEQQGAIALADLATLTRAERWQLWRRVTEAGGWPMGRRSLHRLDDLWRGASGRRLSLGGGRVLCRGERFVHWQVGAPATEGCEPVRLIGSGPWPIGNGLLHRQPVAAADGLGTGDPWQAVIDADAVAGPLVWRAVEPGDRWQALGAPGHRDLRRWLKDRRLPPERRHNHSVLADGAGVVWVPGQTIAERVRIRAGTRRHWHFRLEPPGVLG